MKIQIVMLDGSNPSITTTADPKVEKLREDGRLHMHSGSITERNFLYPWMETESFSKKTIEDNAFSASKIVGGTVSASKITGGAFKPHVLPDDATISVTTGTKKLIITIEEVDDNDDDGLAGVRVPA